MFILLFWWYLKECEVVTTSPKLMGFQCTLRYNTVSHLSSTEMWWGSSSLPTASTTSNLFQARHYPTCLLKNCENEVCCKMFCHCCGLYHISSASPSFPHEINGCHVWSTSFTQFFLDQVTFREKKVRDYFFERCQNREPPGKVTWILMWHQCITGWRDHLCLVLCSWLVSPPPWSFGVVKYLC